MVQRIYKRKLQDDTLTALIKRGLNNAQIARETGVTGEAVRQRRKYLERRHLVPVIEVAHRERNKRKVVTIEQKAASMRNDDWDEFMVKAAERILAYPKVVEELNKEKNKNAALKNENVILKDEAKKREERMTTIRAIQKQALVTSGD